MNNNFSSMIDRYKHQQLRIGSVSPQQVSAWATKILPNGEIVGEVTKPYTFLSDPTHIGPSAQVVWLIVGQEILNGDVGGGFRGIQITSGFLDLASICNN